MCMGADSKGRLHIYSATNYSGAANKRVVIFCEDTRVLNFEVGAGSHRWVVGEKRTIKLKFYMHTIRKLWWPSHSRETRKKNKRIMSFIHTYIYLCVIILFWYTSVAVLSGESVKPCFVSCQELVRLKYPWSYQTSLICCGSTVAKKVQLRIHFF